MQPMRSGTGGFRRVPSTSAHVRGRGRHRDGTDTSQKGTPGHPSLRKPPSPRALKVKGLTTSRVGRGAGRAPGRLGRGVLTAAKRAQALLKTPGRQRWKRSPARPRTPPPGGRPAELRAHARGRARASGLRAPSVRPRTRAHPDRRHGLQTDPTDHTRTYGPRTLCRTRARLGRAHVAQLTQAQMRETKLRGPRSGKRLSVRRREGWRSRGRRGRPRCRRRPPPRPGRSFRASPRVMIHGAAPVTFPEVLGLEDKATGRRDAWLQGPGRRALSRTTTQLAETVKSNHVGTLGTDPKASVHDTL